MLQSLSSWFYRIASWKTLLLGIALYIPFPAYILANLEAKMNALAGQAIGPIDLLMFGYQPERILQMVAQYGEEGRAIYAQGELTADVAYPLIYTFLFGVILSLLYRNKPYRQSGGPLVNVLPVGVMLADFLENICIVTLLRTYPDASPSVAAMCSVFTNLKWAGFLTIIALILYGLARLLINRFSPSGQMGQPKGV